MYYRKHFIGEIENSKTAKTIKGLNNTNVSTYYLINDVICKAIKETLEDVNISCDYDDQAYILTIDSVSVQILSLPNNIISYCINNQNGGITESLVFLNGDKYNFCITIKGEIDSILKISIGFYSSPESETNGFTIGKGTDLKDGTQIRVWERNSNALNSSFFVIKDNECILNKNILFGFQLNTTLVSSTIISQNEITLVECIAQIGRFKLNNCYFGNRILTNNSFYNIDGEVYFQLSNSILVKCKKPDLDPESNT